MSWSHVVRPLCVALLSGSLTAGELEPPGAPAPTAGPESRIAIRATDLPLTISTRGASYYFAEPITFSQTDSFAIFVSERFVTIDLNGFALTGPGATLGTAQSIGIQGGSTAREVTIRNGTITAFGADGVRLTARGGVVEDLHVFDCNERGINLTADNGRVESCTVQTCDTAGIVVAAGSSVVDCVSRGNGDGIVLGDHARAESCVAQANTGDGILSTGGTLNVRVTDCVASGNLGRGIQVVEGTITGCEANENGTNGIFLFDGGNVSQCRADGNGETGILHFGTNAVIAECTANDNTGSGIVGNIAALISRCVTRGNDADGIFGTDGVSILDCVSANNGSDGIEVDRNCTVMNCMARFNGTQVEDGAGIRVSQGPNRIEGNTAFSNDVGIVAGNFAGLLIVRNLAAGIGQTDYDVSVTSALGPVATGFPGLAPPGPWDNFDR